MKQVQCSTYGCGGCGVHNVIAEAGDYYILDSCPVGWNHVCHVAVPKTAVTVVKEVTYKVGQNFKIGDDLALLAQLSAKLCVLIMFKNGLRYTKPIKVGNCKKITQDELNRMSGTLAVLVN